LDTTKAPNIDHQTSVIKHRSPNIGHQTSSIEHQTPDIGHQASSIEHQTPDIGHQTSVIGHQASNIGHQTSNNKMNPFLLNKKLIENQNTELKLIWKDEYLKHICAFANSKGGFLYLGLADDSSVVGIQNTKKLLEDIPNKSIQFLGIYIDVHAKIQGAKIYLIIKVEPSSVPVSFKGVFYKRSGSATQELKGAELQTFILKKSGKTFDDLPLQYATLEDIDDRAVTKFVRKAIKSNRISSDSISDQIEDILTNLKLFSDSGKLKNAAILLFGHDPMRFFTSVSFKIGRFGSNDHDLKFQDVIEGNIFEMPDKVMETLRAKYLISPIRYEGLQRIEELEYPQEALREAIFHPVR
jgi:ATP-dependent DNA helicase RecG